MHITTKYSLFPFFAVFLHCPFFNNNKIWRCPVLVWMFPHNYLIMIQSFLGALVIFVALSDFMVSLLSWSSESGSIEKNRHHIISNRSLALSQAYMVQFRQIELKWFHLYCWCHMVWQIMWWSHLQYYYDCFNNVLWWN